MPRTLKIAFLLCAAALQAITGAAQHAKIAAGRDHSLFLKGDGSLWAWATTSMASWGDGTTNNTDRPEQIVSSNVTAIAHRRCTQPVSQEQRQSVDHGYNGYGRVSDGTYNNTNRPEQIVASNVIAIAAGWDHSLFLKRTAVCGPWAATLWPVG